ncbi:hypothetical protein BBJ29_008595, partial [Phytophthora kernoviae]
PLEDVVVSGDDSVAGWSASAPTFDADDVAVLGEDAAEEAVSTHPRAILARHSAESNDRRQIHCTRHPASPTAHRLAVSTPKTMQLMVPPAAEATLDRHH